eukprot:CAMPEP_0184372068 /NCGR_PEP_ID=MMETSP1089-20130417/163744_1 /TAXON_ID=38269 ORGANISM="Gloeochaete wittrockiana, Strain SAG46.84" /NCGR_SAMPLE_ID=MMETSP1089 /ASSEMBLY_ACC=CAM_ASM_000445 /LENGTH=403 /DNA_ID=CAMNT_0026714887 /DNA_START=398 /DNA_END=1605 /DNA_ORIENTATION=-
MSAALCLDAFFGKDIDILWWEFVTNDYQHFTTFNRTEARTARQDMLHLWTHRAHLQYNASLPVGFIFVWDEFRGNNFTMFGESDQNVTAQSIAAQHDVFGASLAQLLTRLPPSNISSIRRLYTSDALHMNNLGHQALADLIIYAYSKTMIDVAQSLTVPNVPVYKPLPLPYRGGGGVGDSYYGSRPWLMDLLYNGPSICHKIYPNLTAPAEVLVSLCPNCSVSKPLGYLLPRCPATIRYVVAYPVKAIGIQYKDAPASALVVSINGALVGPIPNLDPFLTANSAWSPKQWFAVSQTTASTVSTTALRICMHPSSPAESMYVATVVFLGSPSPPRAGPSLLRPTYVRTPIRTPTPLQTPSMTPTPLRTPSTTPTRPQTPSTTCTPTRSQTPSTTNTPTRSQTPS